MLVPPSTIAIEISFGVSEDVVLFHRNGPLAKSPLGGALRGRRG